MYKLDMTYVIFKVVDIIVCRIGDIMLLIQTGYVVSSNFNPQTSKT